MYFEQKRCHDFHFPAIFFAAKLLSLDLSRQITFFPFLTMCDCVWSLRGFLHCLLPLYLRILFHLDHRTPLCL